MPTLLHNDSCDCCDCPINCSACPSSLQVTITFTGLCSCYSGTYTLNKIGCTYTASFGTVGSCCPSDPPDLQISLQCGNNVQVNGQNISGWYITFHITEGDDAIADCSKSGSGVTYTARNEFNQTTKCPYIGNYTVIQALSTRCSLTPTFSISL